MLLLILSIIALVEVPCFAESEPFVGQLKFRPLEADYEWYYPRGVIDGEMPRWLKKPKMEWEAEMHSVAALTSRQYVSVNFLDPAFLWPSQRQLFLDGDALDQPRTDFMVLPSLKVAVKDMEFLGAQVDLSFNADFGCLTIIGGALAYTASSIKLKWEKTKVLIGQQFHPALDRKTVPNLVAVVPGTPIVPVLAFTPQIQIAHTFNDAVFTTTLYTNSMFVDNGPQGFSAFYQRQGCFPGIDLRLSNNNPDLLVAIGFDSRRLVPALLDQAPIFTDPLIPFTEINAHVWNTFAYALCSYKHDKTTWRAEVLAGQNGTDMLLLGGYGISSYIPSTGDRTYTTLQFASAWIDIEHDYYDGKVQPGFFMGLGNSLGTRQPLALVPVQVSPGVIQNQIVVYTLDAITDSNYVISTPLNLKQVLRVAPRIWFKLKEHFQLGIEISGLRTEYGLYQPDGSLPTLQTTSTLRVEIGTVISI